MSDLKAGDGTEETDLPFLTGGWEGGLDEYVYLFFLTGLEGAQVVVMVVVVAADSTSWRVS